MLFFHLYVHVFSDARPSCPQLAYIDMCDSSVSLFIKTEMTCHSPSCLCMLQWLLSPGKIVMSLITFINMHCKFIYSCCQGFLATCYFHSCHFVLQWLVFPGFFSDGGLSCLYSFLQAWVASSFICVPKVFLRSYIIFSIVCMLEQIFTLGSFCWYKCVTFLGDTQSFSSFPFIEIMKFFS